MYVHTVCFAQLVSSIYTIVCPVSLFPSPLSVSLARSLLDLGIVQTSVRLRAKKRPTSSFESMTSPMQLSPNSRAGERGYSRGSSLTTTGWSPWSGRELALRSFSQRTAIRIFHENISDQNERSTCLVKNGDCQSLRHDEIVSSSIFEDACLQGTCFSIYKSIFS